MVVLLSGLIIGWARKGSIWSITEIKIRWVWILPIAYLLQHVSIAYFTGTVYQVTIVASYVSLITFCLLNLKTPGLPWSMLGTCLNFLAMLFNGLRMPAYVPAVRAMAPSILPLVMKGEYGKSIAMSSATHLNFFGDIFYFQIQPASLLSVGDIVFSIGLVIFIQYAMRLKRGENVVTSVS